MRPKTILVSPLVWEHISWIDVCCYICATIILLYNSYCIYFIYHFIHYILYWGRKRSWFPPMARDHISWRDVCCYIYATIMLLYTLYCIYSYIISYITYYIEAENYLGFCRWFEIIFHERIFCYIFAIIILSYTLFC